MKLISQLKELSEKSSIEQSVKIIDDHSKFINSLSGFFRSLKTELSDTNDSNDVWTKMRTVFTQIKDMCEKKLEDETTFDLATRNDSFQTQINELLENSEKKIESQFSAEFLRSDAGTSFFFKMWKPFKLAGLKIAGFISRSKTQKAAPSFDTANFVDSLWTLPFMKEFYDINVEIYSKIVGDINDIHEKVEGFQDVSMFFESFADVFSTISDENRSVIIDELDKVIEFLDGLYDFMPELKTQVTEKITVLTQSIESDILFKIKYAGTMIVPESSFSPAANLRKRVKIIDKCLSSSSSWKKYYDFCISSWLKDVELSMLQFNTALAGLEIAGMVSSRHLEKIDPSLNSIRGLVKKSISDIVKFKEQKDKDLKKSIMIQNRSILKTLRSDMLPDLLESIRKTNYRNLLDLLLDKIGQLTDNINDTHTIVTKQDLKAFDPKPDTDKIPTKTLIKNEIEVIALKKARIFSDKIKLDQEKLLRRINDIDVIINSNFEASLNILRENEDETLKSIEVAKEGLERTGILVEELSVEFDAIKISAVNFCSSITGELINKTEEFSIDEKVLKLKMLLMREKTIKEIKKSFSTAFLFLEKGYQKLESFVQDSFSRSKKQFSSIKKITGLSVGDDSIGFGFTQYLNSSVKKIGKLPYVYQRLFRMEPLTTDDLFSARKSELNTVRQDYLLWKEGAVASIALYGEKGSGKTTLINIAGSSFLTSSVIINIDLSGTISKEIEFFEILRDAFKLSDTENFEQLETKLIEENNRRVCVVENIENLYLRTVDGFNAIERFLLLISKTHSNIFWIVSSSLYAYMYLDYVIDIKKHFQRSVLLGPLNENEVEDIILARHFSSGYSLVFKEAGTGKNKKNKKSVDEKENQIILRKDYFAELARISDGNIFNSIILWLNSILRIEDEKIIVGSNIVSDYTFISQLPKETQFILAAIIQHDSITVDSCMLMFRDNKLTAEKTLERLTTSGILQKNAGNYYIHPFLFKSITKVLKQNNILY